MVALDELETHHRPIQARDLGPEVIQLRPRDAAHPPKHLCLAFSPEPRSHVTRTHPGHNVVRVSLSVPVRHLVDGVVLTRNQWLHRHDPIRRAIGAGAACALPDSRLWTRHMSRFAGGSDVLLESQCRRSGVIPEHRARARCGSTGPLPKRALAYLFVLLRGSIISLSPAVFWPRPSLPFRISRSPAVFWPRPCWPFMISRLSPRGLSWVCLLMRQSFPELSLLIVLRCNSVTGVIPAFRLTTRRLRGGVGRRRAGHDLPVGRRRTAVAAQNPFRVCGRLP